MHFLRYFLLLVACQGILLADEDIQIQQLVDSWDLSNNYIALVEPKEGTLVISITYKKSLVVDDSDEYGIQLREKEENTFYGLGSRGKSRSNGIDGGCSGVANLANITKDGFEIAFDLDWTNKRVGNGSFHERLKADWVANQQFSKDGFDIKVTIQQKK